MVNSQLSNEDIESWNDFKTKCNKIEKYSKLSTAEGKQFLKEIIIKLKNNKNNDFCSQIDETFTNFSLKKDLTLGIDRFSNKKLTKGKYRIDYTLDLHGETLCSGYEKIKLLFEKAKNNNYKCLLIITGKGLHSSSETIKNSIQKWFLEPYFANKIIKYTDASPNDGGGGAIYVLLKNKTAE